VEFGGGARAKRTTLEPPLVANSAHARLESEYLPCKQVLPHSWSKLAHAKIRKQLKRLVMERSFQKVARRLLPEAGLAGNALYYQYKPAH
jgi:hypothetical protein